MTQWQPHILRQDALQKMEMLLTGLPDNSPDTTQVRFHRAALLAELGRSEEAKTAYLELLAKDPTHFGALNNLGNLLYAMGFKTAASTVYMQAVTQHPNNPKGHINLASLLAENNQPEAAMKHFEAALALDPDHREANRGMAYLLTELRQEEQAELHRKKAFAKQPIEVLPYTGEGIPITILLLVSASGGMIPLRHHFDERIFLVSALFIEFYDESMPLPPHQLVVNAIGDADLCQPALKAAQKLVARIKAPVINQPSAVLATTRLENAKNLAHIPHVIAPHIAMLARTLLLGSDAASMLAQKGFAFPLLLRAPGFHTGRFFIRVEKEEAFASSLGTMPGDEFLVIQYLDTRKPDGKIRKYRVMMIDGALYPVHAAISHDWKIHYFTAEMADNPEHRAEDAAFIENMPAVLGPHVMQALQNICTTLKLDYGGIDFGINASGELVLYEANATMVIHPPDKDARWDYRRPAFQRILDAIRQLFTKHTHPFPPIEELLISGGDARILLTSEGVNKYGCAPAPEPELLSYSSSTASTISPAAFAACTQVYQRLKHTSPTQAAVITYADEMQRIRRELIRLCGLESLSGLEIIFGASGTDLHLFAGQLFAAQAPLQIIMCQSSETGSSVSAALHGQHFSTQTAIGGAATMGRSVDGPDIKVSAVQVRASDGSLRSETTINNEIESLATEAITTGRHVLLIVTDVSKTGLITPALSNVFALKTRFAAQFDILVDACQFRLTNATLRAYLQQNFVLAMTGSKFITAPAFCGALFIPPAIAQRLRNCSLPVALGAYSARADWPPGWSAQSVLSDTVNYGLLLRFEAALTQLRAMHALPEAEIAKFLSVFAEAVQKKLAENPAFEPVQIRSLNREALINTQSWDSITTIFPFLLKRPQSQTFLTRDETTRLYELMQKDLSQHPGIAPSPLMAIRCLMGQPVPCGESLNALRLNIDARLIVDALSGRGQDTVIAEALTVLDKAAALTKYI